MRIVLELGGEEHEIFLARENEAVKLQIEGDTFEARIVEPGVVQIGDQRFHVKVGENNVTVDGQDLAFRIHEFQPSVGVGEKGGARGARIKPPMPGKIVSVVVKEGDEVEAGAVLLILEAMKMQNEIVAPAGGTVKKVSVKPGQNVEAKDVLIEIE